MTLRADDLERMIVEIMTGQPPSLRTSEADQMREQLREECAEIAAKGGIVDVPHEIPDPD